MNSEFHWKPVKESKNRCDMWARGLRDARELVRIIKVEENESVYWKLDIIGWQ